LWRIFVETYRHHLAKILKSRLVKTQLRHLLKNLIRHHVKEQKEEKTRGCHLKCLTG
jgi:hypothetical protein